MASFISVISLFILVLANGCLTLPVNDDQYSSTLSPSFKEELTTGQTIIDVPHTVDVRLVSDPETTDLPKFPSEQELKRHFLYESATTADIRVSEEKFEHATHTFNKLATSEPYYMTTESTEHHLGVVTLENEINDHNSGIHKRDIPVELTTISMPSFTSTSSVVSPHFYTSESSNVVPQHQPTLEPPTSTKKYTGLLVDDKEEPKEDSEPSKVKVVETTTENEDPNAPTAVYDPNALKDVKNVPDNELSIEKSHDVVTRQPEKFLITTMETTKNIKDKSEQIPLNQGTQSSSSEKKESNN